MTDADAPEESGTTEEQHETDGGSIPVETADSEELAEDVADEQEGEQDIAEELAELQDYLGQVDPENVAAVGCVVHLKNEKEWDSGEVSDGMAWRVLNAGLDGYDDTREVLASAVEFNDALDQIAIPTEKPQGPMGGLGALLGE